MYAAVTRRDRGGDTLGARHRISPLEALKMHTRYAAMAGFGEGEGGCIRPGMPADWVMLDRDPTAVPADDIKDVRVLMTVIGGEVVYEAD